MAINEWYVLARLAELVERGEAKLDRSVYGVANTHHLSVTTEHVIENGISDQEQGQLCEMLSARFMERALSLGVDGSAKKECASEQNCISCLALPGQWCRPTHAGERDAGGWVHPERESGESLIGALRDSKHITSAMYHFDSMHFASKRARGIAFAQILHAGLKFGLDMTSWSHNALASFERGSSFISALPDIATGEALDQIALQSGIQRRVGETDAHLRDRAHQRMIGHDTITVFRGFPAPDAGWVGESVVLLNDTTVTRAALYPEYREIGEVIRVGPNNLVDVSLYSS